MMTYQVVLKRSVVKALAKLNEPYYSALKAAIYSLGENPRPAGFKKLKGREGYRIRVGDYRIIYEILDGRLIVDVVALGHRRDIYK